MNTPWCKKEECPTGKFRMPSGECVYGIDCELGYNMIADKITDKCICYPGETWTTLDDMKRPQEWFSNNVAQKFKGMCRICANPRY